MKGLRAISDYNWIEATGIVDRDNLSDDECEKLRQHGVFPLGVHEVENLYYTKPVLQRLAETQARILERDPYELLASARQKAMAALSPATRDHLAGVVAAAQIRRRLTESAPSRDQVETGKDLLSVPIDNPFKAARQQLEQLVAAEDLDTIVKRYPIRDTPLQQRVATELGFQKTSHLQSAARHQLTMDTELLTALRRLAGPLPA